MNVCNQLKEKKKHLNVYAICKYEARTKKPIRSWIRTIPIEHHQSNNIFNKPPVNKRFILKSHETNVFQWNCLKKTESQIISFFPNARDHYRSSTSTAAAAFAIATSASSNPRDEPPIEETPDARKEMISSPATIRVLNVLR